MVVRAMALTRRAGEADAGGGVSAVACAVVLIVATVAAHGFGEEGYG